MRHLRCETVVLSSPYQNGYLEPGISSLTMPVLLDVLNSGMVTMIRGS